MELKTLINIVMATLSIQFIAGFSGIETTDMWDIILGIVLFTSAILATVKVNKQ